MTFINHQNIVHLKRVSVFGLCEMDALHEGHVLDLGDVLQECPGQWSLCRNCDDRKCMGCVFREYDHDCADDCPDCCH
ncbi:hypothetical protein CCUG60885_04294 [Mycobacteroides salmoniphilum]|uniref:Uncharacterized protein n=1 Tax=Mycobacteroides salmoniphilum TaxID=404941 RepID=A0A4R8SC46_9MYCO|nr:hypothetical protein CCUG60885_04294 [Mycobacteroides salmoniphilum]TEA07409.1 hypothetical protein CCUG60883_01442 [Mycobacteroides salmoniphilum]